MAQFLKDVLKPGTVRLPDGRKVTFTRDDVRQIHANLDGMTRAGLQVPVAWNHQSVGPMSPADILAARARHVIGHALEASLEADGRLAVRHDVADEDASAVRKAKYVSPEITWDYVDGTGRKWAGPSITHIAVTGRPVDPHQQPFIQLSQDRSPVRVRLSMEDIMADEPDKMEPDGDEGGGDMAALREALAGRGINIPEEATDLAGFIIAIKAGGEAPADPMGDEPLEPVTDAGPPPVMMSMDAQQELLNYRREDRKRRVRELFKSGRIDRPRALELLNEVGTVQMSMDGKPTGADAEIAAYEKLAPRPWKGGEVRLSMDEITEAPGGPAALSDEDRAARDEAKKTAERYSSAK